MSGWTPGRTDLGTRGRGRRGMLAILGPYRRPFAASVALGVANQGLNIAATVLAAAIVGWAIDGWGVAALRTPLVVLGVLVLARAGAHWGEAWVSHELAFRILAEIRTWQYEAFERLAPGKLLRRRSGDLVARAMSDSQAMEMFYAHSLIYLLVAIVLTPTALVATLAVHPLLTLSVLPWVVLAGVVPFRLRASNHDHGAQLRERLAAVNTEVTDLVQGLREVLSFGRSDDARSAVRARTMAAVAAQHRQGRREGLEITTANAAAACGALTALLVGAWLVSRGRLSATALPAGVMLAAGAFAPIVTLLGATRLWGVTNAAAERVLDLVDEPAAVPDRGRAPRPDRRDVRYEQVSFTYPGASIPSVIDVTFDIQAGETVALIGPSGAGKSTLASLLVRFWDPDAGRILIGGTDIAHLPQRTLHDLVGHVPQDVFLFNTSLADNLRLGAPDATDDQLRSAVTAAQLDEVVESLPDGFETHVGERGVRLSGGERQRVAIARALLHDPPILVLDEAVSMLDPLSERALTAAVGELRRGRTSLVIAHRLSTILTADRLVVVDRGRLVDMGTHDVLLERCALYRTMVEPQLIT